MDWSVIKFTSTNKYTMKFKSLFLASLLIGFFYSSYAQTIPSNFCKRIKKIQKAMKGGQLPDEKDDKKKLPLGRLIGETMYQTTYKFFDSSAVYKMNQFNSKEYEHYAFLQLDSSKTKVMATCHALQDALEKCGYKIVGIDQNKKISEKNTFVQYRLKKHVVTVDMPFNSSLIEQLGYTFYAARLTFEEKQY